MTMISGLSSVLYTICPFGHTDFRLVARSSDCSSRVPTVHWTEQESCTLSPVHAFLESWLALSAEGKEALVFLWLTGYARISIMRRMTMILSGFILFAITGSVPALGKMLFEKKAPLWSSLDKTAGEMRFLKAGEVAKGYRMVFVSGCTITWS